MSSLNLNSLARLALAAGLTLSVSACFRPLYGPTASGESLIHCMTSMHTLSSQCAGINMKSSNGSVPSRVSGTTTRLTRGIATAFAIGDTSDTC